MVENLRLLFKDVTTINIDRFGSLQDWIHKANDEAYWNQLVKRLLHPDTPLPERPETWGPLPSWQARRVHNGRRPPADDNNDDNDKNSSENDANCNDNAARRGGHQSRGRGQHQPPPSPRAPPPTHEQRPQFTTPPPHNTIQNDGSTARTFAHRLGGACFSHSPFSDLDWEHPKQKLKCIIDNLPGNKS